MCSKCVPKVQKKFPQIKPALRSHKDGSIGDYKTDELLTKIGGSNDRGRTIDIGVGAGSKHIILASELAKPDQRGADALDADFDDNAQSRAEAGLVSHDVEPDSEDETNPAEMSVEMEVSDARWLDEKAIEDARILKHIGWFMSSPMKVVCKQTGWHHQSVSKMRTQLRKDCPEIVAKVVAIETARTIAEARAQVGELKKFKAVVGL